MHDYADRASYAQRRVDRIETARERHSMNQTPQAAVSGTVGRLVRPSGVSIEMMEFARPQDDDLWHWANNLNAMLHSGYCKKCGLTPNGCRNEGCRANGKDDTPK